MEDELDIFLDSTEKHQAKSKKSGDKKKATTTKKAVTPPVETKKGFGIGSWLLIIGMVVIVGVIAVQLANQNQIRPMPGDVAPDFTLTTFDGEPLKLSDLRGKVVLVNFWGSWCPPCRAEAPDLQAIWEDYADKGVVIVGVNWLESEDKARAFMDEFGMTYLNAPDIGNLVSKAYRITAAPENFVIDTNGVVAYTIPGAVTYDGLATMFDELLTKGSAS